MIREAEEIIGAVIGPSKCGKTTLAIALVAMLWRVHRLRSIVYDPRKYKNNWGPSAWVTDNLTKFKRAVWGTKGCAIIWDESTDSMNKYDKDDQKFFSQIRHDHKAFFLVCHDLQVMNLMMRGNLSDAYIFRQGVKRAKLFAEEFADTDLLQLSQLGKREWIHVRPFEKARRKLPTLEQLPFAVAA